MTSASNTRASQTQSVGSRTEVLDSSSDVDDQQNNSRFLRLLGSPEPQDAEQPRVTWSEDVVDNEHLNRKKSKICCIYHPKTEFGESEEEEESDYSSSSESSSSGSDSDSSCCDHKHTHRPRKVRPNAYERQTHTKKPAKTQS